ncbi:MAG: DUF4340 domain-containing protein [Synechococcales bacterium]|nr:DUF4340 domain-containing protein [Synechococcales bacterium]
MKLKPLTLIWVSIALVLGIAVYFAESRNGQSTGADASQIFDFEEGEVQAFNLRLDSGETLSFEQAADTWQMTAPETAPADDASVAYLLNLLATAASDRTLTVPASELSDFGLDDPLATIQVELATGESHTLTLGDYDFNRSFLYAQTASPEADSEADTTDEVDVLLVPATFENAVTRPLEEWQADSEESPTESPAEDSGDPSTENSGASPLESPAEDSGESSPENPAGDLGESPATNPTENPAENSEGNSGESPGEGSSGDEG